MRENPLIGVVDSGTSAATPAAFSCAFRDRAGDVTICAAAPDALGHATEMLRLVRAAAPSSALAVAQVFFDSMSTSPYGVAEAVNWLARSGARLINLSLGTPEDTAALRDSCRRALAAGALLVASVPDRGATVYPAAYAGVVRVAGDARCAPGQFALHGTERVDFGACPHPGDGVHRPGAAGGASIAAARVTGALGALLEAGVPGRDAIATLRARCTIDGPRRVAAPTAVARGRPW